MAERLREASSGFKAELKSKDDRISELQSEIESLKGDIAAKDKEIQELRK